MKLIGNFSKTETSILKSVSRRLKKDVCIFHQNWLESNPRFENPFFSNKATIILRTGDKLEAWEDDDDNRVIHNWQFPSATNARQIKSIVDQIKTSPEFSSLISQSTFLFPLDEFRNIILQNGKNLIARRNESKRNRLRRLKHSIEGFSVALKSASSDSDKLKYGVSLRRHRDQIKKIKSEPIMTIASVELSIVKEYEIFKQLIDTKCYTSIRLQNGGILAKTGHFSITAKDPHINRVVTGHFKPIIIYVPFSRSQHGCIGFDMANRSASEKPVHPHIYYYNENEIPVERSRRWHYACFGNVGERLEKCMRNMHYGQMFMLLSFFLRSYNGNNDYDNLNAWAKKEK